jgi:hypothetical protein
MAIVERTDTRMVVEAGGGLSSLTPILDKGAGQARIERRTLMFNRKPREMPLSRIQAVDVAHLKDPASGAEMRQLMLRAGSDEAIPLPVADQDVPETASALRDFLGLAA